MDYVAKENRKLKLHKVLAENNLLRVYLKKIEEFSYKVCGSDKPKNRA
jgi:hypothetical protein